MDSQIDSSHLLGNLEKLLMAHAPSGSEEEMDRLVMDMVGEAGAAVWQDAADSIIIHIRGAGNGAPIAVTAHKDEIAMIVQRMEGEGRLRVQPVGGLWPWALGEGAVEIMGDQELIPGVLSAGSKHTTSGPVAQLKEGRALQWADVWVETKLDSGTLKEKGVRIGSKLVTARVRKNPWYMGEYICGYNLDCRGGVAILIETALHLARDRPPQDVYLVATSEEEIGAHGAVYSVGQLPAETVIALDVVPVSDEYQTHNSGNPILGCKDGRGVYNQGEVKHLEKLSAELDFEVQRAVLSGYGSDASIAKSAGAAARSILLGYPGENTHGYEICAVDGIINSARLLLAYLQRPVR